MASTIQQKITPCLWFDNQAEEAALFYIGIFNDAQIHKLTRYGKEGYEIHGQSAGTVMTISFQLNGQMFTALNGGPYVKFNEAISLQVSCETQEEVDYYWEKLSQGGKQSFCGWLQDKYGLSWQIVPTVLADMLSDSNPIKAQRVTQAFLQMQKFDIAKLRQVYEGS